MSNVELDELKQDYSKLLARHYDMKLSLEAQIDTLKSENRKLRDECKGRGYWLIALGAMLVFSVFLGIFVR